MRKNWKESWKEVGILVLALVAGLAMAMGWQATEAAESQKPGIREPVQAVPVEKTRLLGPALPDLVITSASVTPKCGGMGGTWTANIVATVKNNGQVAADLSKITWQIVLEADWGFTAGNPSAKTVKPQVGGPKELKPGESWTGTLTINGIPKANVSKAKKGGHPTAQFSFAVKADPSNGVAEANEKNNEKLIYLPMTTCSKL